MVLSHERPDYYHEGMKARAIGIYERIEQENPHLIHVGNVIHPHYTYQTPYCVPMQSLAQHLLLLGPTGTGKTSRVFWPLLFQLIRKMWLFRQWPQLAPDGHNHSIHVIDAKGSELLLANVLWAARCHGISVQVFTNSDGYPSLPFNLFQNQWFRSLPSLSRASIFTDGVGLRFGKSLNDAFYGMQNLLANAHIMEGNPEDIKKFAELTRSQVRKQARKSRMAYADAINQFTEQELEQTKHLMAVANLLAKEVNLNGTSPHNIDLETGFHQPTLYYWFLRPFEDSYVAESVTSLVLASLGALVGQLSDDRHRRNYLTQFVFSDEPITTPGVLHRSLVRWREARLRFILSTHAKHEFPKEMCDQICAASGLKMWLAPATRDEREEVMHLSGEEMKLLRSFTYQVSDLGGASYSEGVSEQPGPIIDLNSMLAASANPETAFYWQRMNERGATQDLDGKAVTMTIPHIMKKEFQERLLAEPLHDKIEKCGPGYTIKRELRERQQQQRKSSWFAGKSNGKKVGAGQ